MDKEELLKEAKIRFPVGTRFNSLGGVDNKTIEHHNFYFEHKDTIIRFDNNGLLWMDGIWAEIIYSPIKKQYYFY